MHRTNQAWVTLATNDSYALGALVLGHSLRQTDTTRMMHCLVTPSVSQEMRDNLDFVWDVVAEVNIMDSKDKKSLAMIKRPDLGVTFTKLHCWTLTQYEKCVFLDADCMVVQRSDELFDYPELSAAPDIGWPDIFNSGVFVYQPSNDTFDQLVAFALVEGSFDGGDQGLLNLFFSKWLSQGATNRLPFIYNVAASTVYTYVAALKRFAKKVKIVHFLGSQKPWTLMTDENMARAAVDAVDGNFLAKWFKIFGEQVLTSLDKKFLPDEAMRRSLSHDRAACRCAVCQWCPEPVFRPHVKFSKRVVQVVSDRRMYNTILPTNPDEVRQSLRRYAKEPAFAVQLMVKHPQLAARLLDERCKVPADLDSTTAKDDFKVTLDMMAMLIMHRFQQLPHVVEPLLTKPDNTFPEEELYADLQMPTFAAASEENRPAPKKKFYLRRKSTSELAALDERKLKSGGAYKLSLDKSFAPVKAAQSGDEAAAVETGEQTSESEADNEDTEEEFDDAEEVGAPDEDDDLPTDESATNNDKAESSSQQQKQSLRKDGAASGRRKRGQSPGPDKNGGSKA